MPTYDDAHHLQGKQSEMVPTHSARKSFATTMVRLLDLRLVDFHLLHVFT